MREKHCKFSIMVFAAAAVLLFGFCMLTTSQAFADQGEKGKRAAETVAKTSRAGDPWSSCL